MPMNLRSSSRVSLPPAGAETHNPIINTSHQWLVGQHKALNGQSAAQTNSHAGVCIAHLLETISEHDPQQITPRLANAPESIQLKSLDHPANGRHFFFDVETQGIGQNNKALQLSYLATQISTDANGQAHLDIIDFFAGCFAIDFIGSRAEAVHGISMQHLKNLAANGQINSWEQLTPQILKHAEQADAMIGHNVSFDINSIANTLAHAGLNAESAAFKQLASEKKTCTLSMARQWAQSAKADQQATPSTNKLVDLYPFLMGKALSGAHDAAIDTLACAAVFYALKGKG